VNKTPARVCVIGTGYVGTTTAICFAHVGHQVIGLEKDLDKITKLKAGILPFVEPGAEPMLKDCLQAGNLRFTDNPSEAISSSEIIFICVGTPLSATGEADVEALRSVVTSIAPHTTTGYKTIVTKSTVPVGSGDWITMLIEDSLPTQEKSTSTFGVVSNPEFLREGVAIHDFLFPERIVLGSSSPISITQVTKLYDPILQQSFPGGQEEIKPRLIQTTLESAEMIKYAANAFLATKISFINEIANICERIGGDIAQVAEGIGMDERIGQQFLNAGIGWGGSCFGKDIMALIRTAEEYGYSPQLLEATVNINQFQRTQIIRKLQDELKILKGKRIGLMGLSFKPNTDDLRDAPALTLIDRLQNTGARVSVFDPVVTDLGKRNAHVVFAQNVIDLATGADALVLVTEWNDFSDLDWDKIGDLMRTRLLIDGRNAFHPETVQAAGFRYVGVGRP